LNDEYIQLLEKHNIDYSNASNLTDKQIVEEYRNCDIVNFCSTHEGFGMPIIEAQATGRLVVTSRISPMKEVAGDGAYLVNPYDVSSIRNAYIEIISDAKLRQNLIEKGLKNIKKYQVNNITKQHLHLYQQILQ
jgi:glycosyltransferase involved in cell wall biosynthesis